MDDKGARRVRLPLAVVREPTIAEGSRSLSSWSNLYRDLGHPELVDELAQDPAGVLRRYNILVNTPDEVRTALEAISRRLRSDRENS